MAGEVSDQIIDVNVASNGKLGDPQDLTQPQHNNMLSMDTLHQANQYNQVTAGAMGAYPQMPNPYMMGMVGAFGQPYFETMK